jgi:hypothetical protein
LRYLHNILCQLVVEFVICRYIPPLVIFGFYYNTTRTHRLFQNLSVVTLSCSPCRNSSD